MVTLFSYESMFKKIWFSNTIFLQRLGVCDPIKHFIDNQTLHNPVLGPNIQLSYIEPIPDSVMWPELLVILWHILTALYCNIVSMVYFKDELYNFKIKCNRKLFVEFKIYGN